MAKLNKTVIYVGHVRARNLILILCSITQGQIYSQILWLFYHHYIIISRGFI